MANLNFKTPRWVDKDDMDEIDGRTAEELRTELRAFKAAMAQEQEDTASVAGSISTTEEHTFFKMQTDVEKNAPWLQEITRENIRLFIQAFEKYRIEDQGIRPITALVRTEQRSVLCEHYLMMTVSDFKLLDNDECIQLLSDHFRLASISQYRAKMKTTYMSTVTDENADVELIQKYVSKSLGLLTRNPQFLDIKQKGATPKIMNEIFIEGFSPPIFRNRVKSLGTTTITSTMAMLDSLYDELEIFQGWTSKPKTGPPAKTEKNSGPDEKKEYKPRPYLGCTKEKCNSSKHTPAECFGLHPELKPDFMKARDAKKKAFKSQVAHLAEDMSMSEASVASLVEQVEILKAALAMKADKVFLDIPNTTKIKPKLFDSGNNYSVIADKSHTDPNTNITLTYSEETLGTAGGNNLPVHGNGYMEKLPSVYVPDANASMISVQ